MRHRCADPCRPLREGRGGIALGIPKAQSSSSHSLMAEAPSSHKLAGCVHPLPDSTSLGRATAGLAEISGFLGGLVSRTNIRASREDVDFAKVPRTKQTMDSKVFQDR